MQCPNCGKSNESTYVGFSAIECANTECISYTLRLVKASSTGEWGWLDEAIVFCQAKVIGNARAYPGYYQKAAAIVRVDTREDEDNSISTEVIDANEAKRLLIASNSQFRLSHWQGFVAVFNQKKKELEEDCPF